MRNRIVISLFGTFAIWAGVAQATTPNAASIAASIDGQPILLQEVEEKAAGDLAKEDANFKETVRRAELAHRVTVQALREATLEGIIREKTLAAEAAKSGKNPEAILAEHTATEPTDDEMMAYYKANATPSAPPFDQVKRVIRDRLMADARQKADAELARDLRQRHAVEWLMPREHVNVASDGPIRGAENAPVTLIEFADFQCPYCNRLESLLRTVLARYPTQVKLVYRQLPIPQLHPQAQLAAQVSLCAAEQNKFWPIHDSLFAFFADKGELDGNTLAMLGEAAGLDPEALGACLQSGRVDPLIARDVAAADALGVDGTPALFLNGRPLRGGVSEQSLTDAIEEELARLGRTHP
jgi:predicted DsbA family dithiol-disulfide isomerase